MFENCDLWCDQNSDLGLFTNIPIQLEIKQINGVIESECRVMLNGKLNLSSCNYEFTLSSKRYKYR